MNEATVLLAALITSFSLLLAEKWWQKAIATVLIMFNLILILILYVK